MLFLQKEFAGFIKDSDEGKKFSGTNALGVADHGHAGGLAGAEEFAGAYQAYLSNHRADQPAAGVPGGTIPGTGG